VEHPIGEYDFSLVRTFLFNHAEAVRFDMLAGSSFVPLQNLAKKYRGEIKYHIMHSDTWIKQLSRAGEESSIIMQNALNGTFNLALGIFEQSSYYGILNEMKVFEGEDVLRERWLDKILPVLESASLKMPGQSTWNPSYGGRKGKHTEHLQPLLNEMTEVFKTDPKAEW
jgi:ring-1,2-phenylacetyl-CoA epoxidase subunit PaaC